ncbi:exodeoxyribonuclease VII small subunit [Dysgonomonas sp. 216]|uniref:exodeoxyribonuclease VII small subunit n=1 Tax=Dysgonomonas sp. 216 TaxID=2302934 RepID=UPI0013D8DBE3|nr:exodeoxyribonuclease VII small subunit [Dysgonomonas sp. 216]NDW18400.1 exodeoxyribonuclease VII small subunit [Dysgonomonas sp. 216]
MAKKEKTYSEAMQELEAILQRIESGELDVDVLSEEIKNASVLIKSCKDKLHKADEEIKKILDKID